MITSYYHTESYCNFVEFHSCLVAACQEANRTGEAVKVYRLIEYSNGDTEHIHLITMAPPKGAML